MENCEVRFERTIGIVSMSKAQFSWIKCTVGDLMKRVGLNGAKLFSGIEQGCGRQNVNALLLVAPSQTREAQIWLMKKMAKLLNIVMTANMKHLHLKCKITKRVQWKIR